MRGLLLLIGLFVVHSLLAHGYPSYRERVREFDRKVTWITIILVLYLVGTVVYILFFR